MQELNNFKHIKDTDKWRFPEKNVYSNKTIVCENKLCKDSIILEVVKKQAYIRQNIYYKTKGTLKKSSTYCEKCYIKEDKR